MNIEEIKKEIEILEKKTTNVYKAIADLKFFLKSKRQESLDEIATIVAISFRETVSTIKEKNRNAKVVAARRTFVELAIKDGNFSLSEIARYINRHHTSVIHLRNTNSAYFDNYPEFQNEFQTCFSAFSAEA